MILRERYVLPDKHAPAPRTRLPLAGRDMSYIRSAIRGPEAWTSRDVRLSLERRFDNSYRLDTLLDAELGYDISIVRNN